MNRLTLNLPEGSIQRGDLYPEQDYYGLGDILEVELPNGETIDLGWDEERPAEPFRVVVYREYFGDRTVDYNVKTADDAKTNVESLAWARVSPLKFV